MYKNNMHLTFDALSQNESFARMTVAAFVSQLNPTIHQLADIKTAVSEAVTNAIVHAYPDESGQVELNAALCGQEITIEIIDRGIGISDVPQAMEPFFTTCGDGSRSGMGFMVMKSFMDSLEVTSVPGEGTKVVMRMEIEKQEIDIT